MTDEYRPELTKVTANFTPRAIAALINSAQRDEMSRTDVLNRAVQLYDFLGRQWAEGHEILTREVDGSISKITLI